MPDIGPLNPNSRVTIAYPDVPEDCGNRLGAVITAIEHLSTTLFNSSTRVQDVINPSNRAVQTVAGISQGKASRALVQTWFYSLSDGNQAHGGMSNTSSHLRTALSPLYEHVPIVQRNMSTLNMVRDNGGTVAQIDSDGIQSQINELANALGNIGIALQVAAKLINAMNSSWPQACATGFIPGVSNQPAFAHHSFDNTMHMSGLGGAPSLESGPGKAILDKLGDRGEAKALVSIVVEEADPNEVATLLQEVATLLQKGINPDTIVEWLGRKTGANLSDLALLLNREGGDVAQIMDRLQVLNDDQLAVLRNRAAQNPKINAADLMQLADPELKYSPNLKHDVIREGVGPQPGDGQLALDNSVSYKPTSNSRVGIDPTTDEIVVLDDTNDGTYHGHVETWNQLDQKQQNALVEDGFVNRKGRIILRDAQGNIIGVGKKVPGS